VLFVFAINIAGEEPVSLPTLIPRPVVWGLILACLFLVGYFGLNLAGMALPVPNVEKFATVLWEQRSLDVLLQVVLIFGGVLGVLGLLSGAVSGAKEKP
jgi:hypothetical protein